VACCGSQRTSLAILKSNITSSKLHGLEHKRDCGFQEGLREKASQPVQIMLREKGCTFLRVKHMTFDFDRREEPTENVEQASPQTSVFHHGSDRVHEKELINNDSLRMRFVTSFNTEHQHAVAALVASKPSNLTHSQVLCMRYQ